MTNLYNLSQLPKIFIIHGLNNNQECFKPFQNSLESYGYETQIITLPNHGDFRDEGQTTSKAVELFSKSMSLIGERPYIVIAFSQGALYLQNWLKVATHRPLKQILLSPALFIKRQNLIKTILKLIPRKTSVFSLSPEPLRKYKTLKAWDYLILLESMENFQKNHDDFIIPTLILIDPKDELIDYDKMVLSLKNTKIDLVKRDYLKTGLSKHHVTFHPDYFNEKDWTLFNQKIIDFINLNGAV